MDYVDEKSRTPPAPPRSPRRASDRVAVSLVLTLALIAPFSLTAWFGPHLPTFSAGPASWRASSHLATASRDAFAHSVLQCQRLHQLPGPPGGFDKRTVSDRFVEGTPPVLIQNASIWTGEDDGFEVLNGDVFIRHGLIQSVGTALELKLLPEDTVVHNAQGAWLTPGIFDMHSHIGVYPSPDLSGASDGNSVQNPVLPFLRSLDSLNTHDASYRRSIAGGVTSALILPGSANNVGGQAFVIKLRETKEKTPDSRVLEMPYHIPTPGQVEWKAGDPPRWRHMKMACGENIRRVYHQVRMDLAWNFRSSFEEARLLKVKQDEFCNKALLAHARGGVLAEKFPDSLQWEALVDVLRGKVKVNTHCYESTDFAAFVRHTNEFQFPIAAFHHAHEAYLVPDLLKSAWNSTPAVAIFATNARYKREAWRGSEYASRILSENNITVIFKSDHPVLDSRYLMFEAQQGHHFGLPENLALAAVTTKSAATAGFGHRLGLVRKNYDADLVLWDSHPLSLGATPVQVFIDGIAQLQHPHPAKSLAVVPEPPPMVSPLKDPITLRDDNDEERRDWQRHGPKQTSLSEVLFTNVSEVLLRNKGTRGLTQLGTELTAPFSVHVRDGSIACIGACATAASDVAIDLKGGSLLPPLVVFGPALGLTEMISEQSTTDAPVYDPLLTGDLSHVQQQWGTQTAVRAIDGLEFGGKHLRITKEAGLAKAVTAPLGQGFFRGVSVAFRVDAKNVLEKGAIIKEVVALHVTLGHFKLQQRASVSTQIGELRRLLLGGASADLANTSPNYFVLAARGEIPLVINAWKADTIATVILLKEEVEKAVGTPLKWIIHGGQEAHLVADDLAAAGIAVILSPPRAFPESWDERRALPGPPLSKRSAPAVLHNAGVVMGLGVPEEWQARTLLWEAAWAARSSHDEISRSDAISWLSSNIEEMFDLPATHDYEEFVAFERDPFEFGSRAVAASSADGLQIDLLE